jgi:threonine/homoserine/homoserine lactone efflux protein
MPRRSRRPSILVLTDSVSGMVISAKMALVQGYLATYARGCRRVMPVATIAGSGCVADIAPWFASAVGLGIAYAAAPGAVNTESIRRGLAWGFRPALLVQVGALIGDVAWAIVALSGVTLLVRNPSMQLALGAAGGCFLLRLAWRALAEARTDVMPEGGSTAARGDFATGAVFSLANPVGLAFWTGIGSGVASSNAGETTAGLAIFLVGFVFGAFVWCVAVALAVTFGRRRLRRSLVRWVNALSGLILGYFGLKLCWTTMRRLVA